jgi:hypothetical protein
VVTGISKRAESRGKDAEDDMEGESGARISRKRSSMIASVGEGGVETLGIDGEEGSLLT